MNVKHRFNTFDIKTMAPMEKIGILATRNPEGLPHITFINSLMAVDETTMTLGQFVRGNSKYHIRNYPEAAFFILCPRTRKTWAGKITWTGKKDQGPELETYKEMPIQRYNSYFPIHRVHYFDLKETTPATPLPIVKIAGSAVMTRILGAVAPKNTDQVLNSYGQNLLASPTTLKFLSFTDREGFPVLIPLVSCMTAGSKRLVFPARALKAFRDRIGDSTDMAVFALKTSLESVLVRGKFIGFERILGVKTGMIDLNWVYNSMPPNAGQIYPEKGLQPVTSFE